MAIPRARLHRSHLRPGRGPAAPSADARGRRHRRLYPLPCAGRGAGHPCQRASRSSRRGAALAARGSGAGRISGAPGEPPGRPAHRRRAPARAPRRQPGGPVVGRGLPADPRTADTDRRRRHPRGHRHAREPGPAGGPGRTDPQGRPDRRRRIRRGRTQGGRYARGRRRDHRGHGCPRQAWPTSHESFGPHRQTGRAKQGSATTRGRYPTLPTS